MTPSTGELEASNGLQGIDLEESRDDGSLHGIQDLVERLSLGERVVDELTACGQLAIGPLREFLFGGPPAADFQPRKWAVEALSALGAKRTLMEYLNRKVETTDAAARLGEAIVQGTAARELMAWRNPDVCKAILALAAPAPQIGLVEALRELGSAEAISYLIGALEDDACRASAEDALRKLGESARPALLGAALTLLPAPGDERRASVHRRTSALNLLAGIGLQAEWWPVLRPLIDDREPEIVVAVSKLAAIVGAPEDRMAAARRLIEVLPQADWFLQAEVEALLLRLDGDGTAVLEQCIEARLRVAAGGSPDRVLQTLRRVQRRQRAPLKGEST
jgi:hypothetical protein